MNRLIRSGGLTLLLTIGLLFSPLLLAANGDVTLFSTADNGGGQDYNVKIEILILMTLLGLLPIMVLMMTCFTRFIIVLAILRQALGLQQSPPNKILTGIALALTLLVMRPVWTTVYNDAVVPYQSDQITMKEALVKAEAPLKNTCWRKPAKSDGADDGHCTGDRSGRRAGSDRSDASLYSERA